MIPSLENNNIDLFDSQKGVVKVSETNLDELKRCGNNNKDEEIVQKPLMIKITDGTLTGTTTLWTWEYW